MKAFQFKQFSIIQEKSAMKVGTDGVLLGAWVNTSKAKKVLDIGAGTGLISLMIAQRNKNAHILAIEIDAETSIECNHNFKNSLFKERLFVLQKDFKYYQPTDKFDLIVSNPPFFNNSYNANSEKRNTARQTSLLSFKDLLSKTTTLLSPFGIACFIIPFLEEKKFIDLATTNNLFLNKRTRVRGNISTAIKRSLLEFSFEKKEFIASEIAVEISRHVYTPEYIELTKDFYLKM